MGGTRWPVTLTRGDLSLRPIRYRDRRQWETVRRRNATWLSPWEASNPAPGGYLPNFLEMVRYLHQQARVGAALPFVITERQPPQGKPALIGQVTVSTIVWGSAMSATLGYWVDQQHAGRGVAPTAVAMATDHCINSLGLHRIEVNIRPENTASLRVVQKLGFRDEGMRLNYLHINGRWSDHRSFALTAEEMPAEGLLQRWLTTGAMG